MHKIYIIENNYLKVELIDLAASVYQIYFKDQGELLPLLSTPKTHALFIENTLSYGRTIGRTSGRLFNTEASRKYVDFKDEPFFMHGGLHKFSTKKFDVKTHTSNSIAFALEVEDMSDGYIGSLSVLVTYSLKEGDLIVNHQAKTDKDTLLNMTFHPYFNLDQSGGLNTHELKIYASTYLAQNEQGRFVYEKDVVGTQKDYLDFKHLNITKHNYLDDIFILPEDKHALTLKTKDLIMDVYSNYKSLVVYTQNKPTNTDLSNAQIGTLYQGIAIECQNSQKDLNILKKDDNYDYHITYSFQKNSSN